MDNKIIAIEYNQTKTDYNEWTVDRIKGAFNFGNGTIKNFKEYVKNNKNVYFKMEVI